MDNLTKIFKLIDEQAKSCKTLTSAYAFKTGKGEYAEHDKFIGVSVPFIRKLAKLYESLSFSELRLLIISEFNEHRLLALIILVNRYNKATKEARNEIYKFYTDNIDRVNNWNLVDTSAHYIIGQHIEENWQEDLTKLAKSDNLWKKRISIVSTLIYIRNNKLDPTFFIAKILLNDPSDLIHKAVGWMLREAGKKDVLALTEFLDKYSKQMPRTMLRYAIEKFTQDQRKFYLAK